jgi:hypothetical protein
MGLILDSSVLIVAERKGRNARQALSFNLLLLEKPRTKPEVALSPQTVDASCSF